MDMDSTPRQDPINKSARQQNAITNYTVRLSPSKIFSTKPTRGPKKDRSAPRSRVNIKSEATSSDESSESSDRPVHRNRRRRLLPSTMQTRQNTEKHHVADNDYIVISSCCSDTDTSDDDTMAAMSLRSKRHARIHQTYLRKTSQRLKKEKAVAQKQSDISAKNSSEVIVHPANLAGPQKFKEPRSVISVSLSQENLQSMVWPTATVIIKPLSPSSVVMSRGKYLICSQSPKCRRSSCSVATPSGSGSKVDKSSPLVSSSKSRKTVTIQSATVTSPKSTRETLSNLVAQTSAPPSDREGGPTAKETSAASSVMSTKARDEPCKSPLFGNNPSISRSLQSIKSRQPGSRECEKINADYADMIKSMRQLMPERYARKGRRSCKMSLQSESMPTPVVRLQKVVGSAEMKSRLQDGKKLLMTCRDSVAPSTGSNAVEHKNIRVASSSHSFPESETPSGTSAMKSTTSSDAKTRRMSSSPVNPDSKKRRLSRLSFGTSPSKRSSLIAPLLTSSGQIQQHNVISANQQRKLDPQRHFLAESTKGQKSSNVHRIPVDDVVERIFDKGQLSRRRALGQRISDASENSAVMSQLSHGSSVTSDSRTKKKIRIAEIEKRMKVLETLYAGNWSDEGITESPKNAGLYKSSEQDIMTSPKNAALSENAKILRTTKSNSDHAVAVTTEKKSPSMEELVHDILVQEVVRTRRRQKLMSQRERQSNRCRTSNLIQQKKIFPTKIAESKSKRSEPGTSFSHNTTPGMRQCRDKSPVLRNSSRLSRRQSSSTLSHQRSNDCHVNNGKSRSSSSTVVPVTQHVQLPTKDLKNATDCDVTEANLNHQPNSPKATESALDSTLSPLDGAVAKKQPILDTSVQNPGIQEPVVIAMPAGVQTEQVKVSRHEAKNKLPETSVSTRIASSSDCNASSIRQQSFCRLTDSQMFALSHFKVITFVKVPVTTVLPIRPNHNVMIAGTKPRDNFQIHNDHSYARLPKPMQDRVGMARQVGAAIPSANGRETESRISQHAACSRDEEGSSSANRSMKSDDNDRDQAKQTDCDVTATGNNSNRDDNSIPVTMTPQTSSTDDMITVSNSSSDNGMSPGSVQPSVTNNSKSLNRDVGDRGHVTNDYLKLLEGIENNIIYVEDGEDDVKIPSQQQISEDSSDVIIISDGSEGVSETETPPDDITSPMASPTQSRDGSCPSIGLTQSAPQLSVTPSPRSSPTQPIEPSQSKVSPSHPIESTSAGTFAASTNLYDIKHFFDDNLEKDSDDEELPRLLPYEELDEFRRKRSRDDSDLDQDSDEIPDLPETPSSKRRRLQLSQDSQEETSVLHRSTIRMLNESIESIHNSSIDLKGVGEVGEAERDDDIKSRLRITEPYHIEPRMQVTTIVKDNTFSEAYKKHGASLQKLVKDRMRENRIAEMEASLIADLQRGSLSQILDDCDETEGPMDELDEATKKTMILIKRDWGALPIEEVNSAIYQHGSIGFCRHTMSLDKYFSREETKALEPHLKKWVTRCKLGDRLSGRRRIIEGLLDKPATRVQTLAWAVDGMICHPDSRDFFNLVHSKLKKSETPLVDFQSFKSLVCRAGIKPEILGLDEEDNGIRSFDKICPRCRPRFRDSSRTVTVLKLISNTSVIGESVTHFVEYVTLLLLAQHETSFIFQRSEIIAIIMKCLDATHDWNATKFLVSQRLLDSPTQLNVTRDIAVRLLMMGKRAIELSRIIAFSTLSRHVLSTTISRDEDLDDLETFMPIVANFNLENIEDNLAVNDEDSNTEKRVFRQMSLLLPMLGICIARDCKDAQTSSTIDRMAGILRTMMKRIRDNGYIYRSGVKYELTAFTTTLRHLVLKAPKANKFSIFKYLRADPVEEEHVVMEQGLS